MGGKVSNLKSTKTWTKDEIDAIQKTRQENKDGNEKNTEPLPVAGKEKTVKDQIPEASAKDLETCAEHLDKEQRDKLKEAIYALADNPKFYAIWPKYNDKVKERESQHSIEAFKYKLKKCTSEAPMTMSDATLESVPKLPKYEKTKGPAKVKPANKDKEVDLKEGEEEFTIDKDGVKEIITGEEDLLKKTVVLKLNGGLGTGMGLDCEQPNRDGSQLAVKKDNKKDVDFLDLITMQADQQAKIKFVVMNSSTATTKTTPQNITELKQHKALRVTPGDFAPAESPGEWCAPGHGDLYTALYASDLLNELVNQGKEYMFVSNSDNVGATMDLKLLTYFAKQTYKVDYMENNEVKPRKPEYDSVPFMMEVVERTEADMEGGHLAIDKNGANLPHRYTLRESAQCSEEDKAKFQDTSRYQYFNTNNLWINLKALQAKFKGNNGISPLLYLPLPVMKKEKKIKKEGKEETVFQLETAVGAAISCFEGAMAIQVPRTRFVPVKTCADLLAIRSDAYELSELKCLKLVTSDEREVQDKSKPPIVKLDKAYKNYVEFEKLITAKVNIPSLIKCESMEIKGPKVEFAKGVIIKGNVTFVNNRTNPVEEKKVEDNKTGSNKKDEQAEGEKEPEPEYDKAVIPAGVYNGGKGKTYEAGGKQRRSFEPDEDPHWIVR